MKSACGYAEFYTHKMLSKRAFSVYKKLESAVKKSGIELPDMDNLHINYFKFKKHAQFPKEFKIIDLTAAYPTALFNLGYINAETLKLMLSLPKKERLQVTGMLATQKVIFSFIAGIPQPVEILTNPLRPVFFAACYEVGELLNSVYEKYNSSLFYWVDGIGVIDNSDEIINYFSEKNYPSKIEAVSNCRKTENGFIFDKDGKRKVFLFPEKKIIKCEKVIEFLNRYK
jgi:hypothetical protein